MTRRARTLLFLLAATAGNLVLTIALFAGLLVLYSATLGQLLKLRSAALPILACFALAVLGSTLAYHKVLDRMRKRPGFEEKFGLRG